jgi:hypothetical protein
LALLGFDCQEANQPHSPMINWWCCEQHRIREIGLLPLHVGYLFKTGYCKEPESSLSQDFLRIWEYEESKYISEDERGGFKVAKVNLPLSDGRLRLFLEGKEDWLEEGHRRSHKPHRISTLKTKYHLLWLRPWPQTIIDNGSSIQGRSMVPRLKTSSISPTEKYFRYLPYLYHLFARGRATSKHGGGGRYNAILEFKGSK